MRSKGTGSVFWSQSEKTWTAKITLPDGREKRKRSKNKRIVEDWLFEMRKAMSENRALPDGKTSFEQFTNRFLQEVAIHTLKPKTFEFYSYILTSHVIPEIGKIKLVNLRPQHLQSLYAKKIDSGLSTKTVHHIHATTRRVLNEAIKGGLIYTNPCNQVTPPRINKKPPTVWTIEQAQIFLNAVAEHRWYAIYLIALTTGARRGEVLGMEWENINWDRGTITIDKTVISLDNKTIIGEPKTARAKRTISLPQSVLDTLAKDRQEKGLIFQTSNGTPITPRNLYRHFKEASAEAGLPEIRFHDLRHTCATILLKKNVNPRLVQELLGHSSIVTTLDVYSHVIEGMNRKVADTMDETFKL